LGLFLEGVICQYNLVWWFHGGRRKVCVIGTSVTSEKGERSRDLSGERATKENCPSEELRGRYESHPYLKDTT
jgi:hypothetical protein